MSASIRELVSVRTADDVRGQMYEALRGIGSWRHEGRGTGSVSVKRNLYTSKAEASVRIEVLESGDATQSGSVRVSVDGGKVWSEAQEPIPAGLDFTSSLGFAITLEGAFVKGDTYAMECAVPRFTPTNWHPFSVPVTMTDITAKGISDLTDLVATIGRSGFVTMADGRWLDIIAGNVYGFERLPALAARVKFSFTNANQTPVPVPTGSVTLHDSYGHRFRNVEPKTLPAEGSAEIECVALETGLEGGVVEGALEMDTTIAGVSVTALSDGLMSPGRDEETDEELRVRCLGKWGTIPRSPTSPGWATILLTAVPTLTRVSATPSMTRQGGIDIVCANALGGATASEVTAADSVAQRHVPLGLSAVVSAATERSVDVTATIEVSHGFGNAAKEEIVNGLARMFAETPIGGNVVGNRRIVSREAVIALVQGAVGVLDCDVTAPAADIVLGVGEIPVIGEVSLTAEDA